MTTSRPTPTVRPCPLLNANVRRMREALSYCGPGDPAKTGEATYSIEDLDWADRQVALED